ncbi:DUF2057 family protein [Vibrio maerlii]|uniref:DUF2057 family protein n=1 Tax=Vibrio maerlii TaxID=2231648 RepID=UPI000E3E1022|nr:DUF2057 family protein [Vibrio maerlii]
MNKIMVILGLALISTFTHANVTIKTDSRVEILAVNQVINDVPKKGKGDLKIENGINQLLIRVTALVDSNGGKQKFNSFPMVVKFEARDQVLEMETPFAIRDERGVRKFEKAPSIKVTSDGKAVAIETDLIYDQTFAFIKDYGEMLTQYNLAGGPAAIELDNFTQEPKIMDKQPKEVGIKPTVSIGIKGEFLDMTPLQRQEFISWAVKHIND